MRSFCKNWDNSLIMLKKIKIKFSMTFHELPLLSKISKPGFTMMKFHYFAGFPWPVGTLLAFDCLWNLVSGHVWKQFVPYVTKHTTVECLRDHFYVTIYFDWRNESFAHHLEDRIQCVHASLRSTITNIYHYVLFIIYVLFVIIFFKKTYFAREQ